MAINYAQQVSDPAEIAPVVGATKDSTSGAIGAALGGLANIFDVGLKASAKDRTEKQVAEFQTEINPIIQGMAQGRVKSQDGLARISATISSHSARHPSRAVEFQKAAQDAIGVNPNEAIIKAQQDLEKDEATQRQQQQQAVFTQSLQRGTTVVTDGQYDPEATQQATITMAAIDADNTRFSQELDNKLKQAKLKNGKPLTTADRDDLFSQTYMHTVGDQYQAAHMAVAWKNLDNLLKAESRMEPEAYKTEVLNAINQLEQRLNIDVEKSMTQWRDPNTGSGMSVKAKGDVWANYKRPFDEIREFAKGDISNFANVSRSLKNLSETYQMDLATTTKTYFVLKEMNPALAAQLVENYVNQHPEQKLALSQEVGDAVFGGHPRGPWALQNLPGGGHAEVLQDAADSLSTGKPLARTIAPVQVGRTVQAAVDMINKKEPSKLIPEDVNNWGNGTKVMADHAVATEHPQDLLVAARQNNTPQARLLFDQYAKSHPGEVDAVAKSLRNVNVLSLQRNSQQLTPVTVTSPLGGLQSGTSFQNAKIGGAPATTNSTFTPVYNAGSGRIEVQTNLGKGFDQNMTASLPKIPELSNVNTMASKVRDLNNSLDMLVKLKPYGDDFEKGLTDQQYKALLMSQTGIPVAGVTPEDAEEAAKRASVNPTTGSKPPQQSKEEWLKARLGSDGQWIFDPGKKDAPGFGPGNLDKASVGKDWTTVEVGEDGSPVTYVLPTQPGDKPSDDDTGFLGDTFERYKKTGKYIYRGTADEAKKFMTGEQSLDWNRLTKTIARAESYSEKPYFDRKGYSVGYGHQIRPGENIPKMDKATAEMFLSKDIQEAHNDIQKTKWFQAADTPARQEALVEMTYQMGLPTVLKFTNSLRMIEQKKWTEAGANLRKSAWYNQTRSRAERIIKAIETGK